MRSTFLMSAATLGLCSMADPAAATLGAGLDPAATLGAGGTPPAAPATLGTGIPAAAPATLGTAPAAPAAAAAPAEGAAPAVADDPNILTFRIPNTETDIGVALQQVPPEVRLDFLKKGLKDYIVNSVNQANMRAKKENAPFDAYDEAVKADPLQTAVAKPTGERKVPDLLGTAAAARDRLYKGEVRKQDSGGATKSRTPRDPLIKMVTDAVVRELHDKKKGTVQGYKYTDAVKEVGSDGVAYLNAMIAAKVAAVAEGERAALTATLEKFRDERYIKPAEMMLGRKGSKATKDQSLLG